MLDVCTGSLHSIDKRAVNESIEWGKMLSLLVYSGCV